MTTTADPKAPSVVPRMPHLPAEASTVLHLRAQVAQVAAGQSAPRLSPETHQALALAVQYAASLSDALADGSIAYRYRTRARDIVARSAAWQELLVYSVQPALRSFVSRHRKPTDAAVRDDLYQACWLAAVLAIRTFDPSKGSYLAWCHTQLRGTVSEVRGSAFGDRLSKTDQRIVSHAVRIREEGLTSGDAELREAVRRSILDDMLAKARTRDPSVSAETIAANMVRRGLDRAIRETVDVLAAAKDRPVRLDQPLRDEEGGVADLHDRVGDRRQDVEGEALGDLSARIDQLAFGPFDDELAELLRDRVVADDGLAAVSSTRSLAADSSYSERDLNLALAHARRRVASPVHQYCFLTGAIATVFSDDAPLPDPLEVWARA